MLVKGKGKNINQYRGTTKWMQVVNFEATKEVKSIENIKIIKAFGLESKKTLLVTSETNKNIYLSSRNIKNSKVIINSELNTYEITDANNILILESAVEGIETTLK